MSRGQDRGRLDWLVELAGACAPATAAGFAAMKLAPAYGFPLGQAVLASFAAVFVVAFAVMRLVPAEARHLRLPEFERAETFDEVEPLDEATATDELLLYELYVAPEELLLDQPVVEPVVLSAVAELLLDDPLPAPEPDSRVVQLFAGNRMPTAGQLQQRIDRHLSDGERKPVSDRGDAASKDASDALSEALAELRRSLRQA